MFCYHRNKIDTWKSVENEFNRNAAYNGVYRSGIILKIKYENLKKRLFKKIGNEKAGVSSAGGGPYRKEKYDGSDQIIGEILGDKQLGH